MLKRNSILLWIIALLIVLVLGLSFVVVNLTSAYNTQMKYDHEASTFNAFSLTYGAPTLTP